MKLLLVEDNLSIIKGLVFNLDNNGYSVETKTTISDAKEYIRNNHMDLIILDVTFPDGNGFDLFNNYIKEKKIPTIFLTAKDDEESIVKGLNIGAEDYLTKPFSTKELLARINKILLRYKKENIIVIEDIKFDTDKLLCYKNDKEINLSSLEIKLLYILIVNLNKTVSRNVILDKIWELTGNFVDDHTVTVYYNRIREKLGTNIIKTVKGIGYRIDYEK